MLHSIWIIPLALYVLWVAFLAVANIEFSVHQKDVKMHVQITAIPLVAVMIAMDVVFNVFVFTLLLAEWPREWTVSQRLRRHMQNAGGWRRGVALFVEAYLDPFDHLGDHI